MADVLAGVSLRAVDSNDDVKKIGIWGEVNESLDLEAIKAKIDAGVAVHGLLCVGEIKRYIDNAVDMTGFDVPSNKNLVRGDLIISRTGKGAVYFSGKYPDNTDDLNMICGELIAGAKLIGEAAIAEVKPRVNTGQRFIK